jgi:hypothetical protein
MLLPGMATATLVKGSIDARIHDLGPMSEPLVKDAIPVVGTWCLGPLFPSGM